MPEFEHVTDNSDDTSYEHTQSLLLKKVQALLSSNDLIQVLSLLRSPEYYAYLLSFPLQKHIVPIAPPLPPAATANDRGNDSANNDGGFHL